jgi:hypothetical protein
MSVRRWLGTTPGRLRVASVALLLGLLVVGVIAATAANARGDAARAVGLESVPELVAAQNLYVALSDADATASKIFLSPGNENPQDRQRYLDDLDHAGQYLSAVSRDVGSSAEAQRAVRIIAEQLPVYAGRIDTARANIRQGFVVGAAYQRAGSNLMRDEILPEATTLYERAARQLDDTYHSGTSTSEIVFVVVSGAVLLLVLIGVQLFVTRHYRRIVNVGLLGASVLVLIVLVWTVARFSSEQDALVRAQRNGSDQMQVLSSARILTLRAQSDDQLALVERGTGDTYRQDFDTFSQRLGGNDGTGGLLGEATAMAARTGSTERIQALTKQFVTFLSLHKAVLAADKGGNYDQAVLLAVGDETVAERALDGGLGREIAASRQQLDAAATDARRGFDLLAIAIPVLAILAGVLVLIGLQRRITEYR